LQPAFASARYPLCAPDGRQILFAGTQILRYRHLRLVSHRLWSDPAVRTGAGPQLGRASSIFIKAV
jgi:hypothetical protein